MLASFRFKKKIRNEISRRVTEACDQIMNEMGAEIHDDLIQKLSIFRLYLDRLESSGLSEDELEMLLIRMRTDFNSVTDSVRKISSRLMPVKMDNDSFGTTIQLLCQNMEIHKAGNIHFEQTGDEQRIEECYQIHLYRIIQELVHNAFKHSSAWHLWVRLIWSHQTLNIEVEDDGTRVNQATDYTKTLKQKFNTLRMRSGFLGASLEYYKGEKGLLTKIKYKLR